MARWQGKKYPSIFKPLLVILLLLAVIVLTKSVYFLQQKKAATAVHRDESLRAVRELEGRHQALLAAVELLKTPRGEEAEIRANFPVVLPGEKVITVVEDGSSASSNASTTEISLWQRLFEAAFKRD